MDHRWAIDERSKSLEIMFANRESSLDLEMWWDHRHVLKVFGFYILFLVCFEISYKNVKMRNSEAKRVHNILIITFSSYSFSTSSSSKELPSCSSFYIFSLIIFFTKRKVDFIHFFSLPQWGGAMCLLCSCLSTWKNKPFKTHGVWI